MQKRSNIDPKALFYTSDGTGDFPTFCDQPYNKVSLYKAGIPTSESTVEGYATKGLTLLSQPSGKTLNLVIFRAKFRYCFLPFLQ